MPAVAPMQLSSREGAGSARESGSSGRGGGWAGVFAGGGVGRGGGRRDAEGSRPSWADAKHLVRPADPAGTVNFRVYLGWADGAEALARAVSDPRQRLVRPVLSPAQFRQRFAPAQAQVGAVQSWLRSQGFSVDYTPANNHYVAAEGTVAQAEAAFGDDVRDVQRQRPDACARRRRSLTVPASLAEHDQRRGRASTTARLSSRPITSVDKNAPPSAGFRNAPPLSDVLGATASRRTRIPTGFTDRRRSRRRAVDGKGLHACADQGRLRHQRRLRRRGPDRRGHRRLRVADDPAGRQSVVDAIAGCRR